MFNEIWNNISEFFNETWNNILEFFKSFSAKETLYCIAAFVIVNVLVIAAYTILKRAREKEEYKANMELRIKEKVKEELKKELLEELQNYVPASAKAVSKPVTKTSTTKETKVEKSQKPVAKVEAKHAETTKTSNQEVVTNKEVSTDAIKHVGCFHIIEDKEKGSFRYSLNASNGMIIVISEPYNSLEEVMKGIDYLKNAQTSVKTRINELKPNMFTFDCLDKSGNVIATSSNRQTKDSTIKSVDSFYKNLTTTKPIKNEELVITEEEYSVDVETVEGGSYQINQKDGKYYFSPVDELGRPICTSDGFNSSDECVDQIKKFSKLVYKGKYILYKCENSMYRFNLLDNLDEVVFISDYFSSKLIATNTIISLKKCVKGSKIPE